VKYIDSNHYGPCVVIAPLLLIISAAHAGVVANACVCFALQLQLTDRQQNTILLIGSSLCEMRAFPFIMFRTSPHAHLVGSC
jgi:hypothetical protein